MPRADELRHEVEVAVALVLRADRDLRQPRVLVVDRVADDAQLRADDVHADVLAGHRRAEAERLPCVRQLDAVVQTDRHAARLQAEVADVEIRVEGRRADLVAGAVAGDERPGDDAAARRALERRHAARRQQASPGERARRAGREKQHEGTDEERTDHGFSGDEARCRPLSAPRDRDLRAPSLCR